MIALLPWVKRLWPAVAGVAAIIAIGLWIKGLTDTAYDLGKMEERQKWQAAQIEAEAVARQKEAANRAETARRYEQQHEAINAAYEELEVARRDAAAAAATGQRLRAQIASLTASCRAASDPGTAATGTAASPAGDLLERVQSRLGEATEAIARYADEARTAGLACERSYDALSK